MKTAIIIGSGLGGLSTALRLSTLGYKVTVLEKGTTPGGRLNQFKKDGFTFDVGPSFMSMSYELDELFKSINEKNPVKLTELDPLYKVFFEGQEKPYRIWKNLEKLENEFKDIEPDLGTKVHTYLTKAGEFFHDTEDKIVKSNYDSMLDYVAKLTRVPLKHLPYLFRNLWKQVEKNFQSEEVRIIFSLVAFFLGSTPFQTPAIYSLLNYTEMRHDGYWKVEGGMYKLVEEIMNILNRKGVEFVFNTEIVSVANSNGKLISLLDNNGKQWECGYFHCKF